MKYNYLFLLFGIGRKSWYIKNVKSTSAKSIPVENLLPQNVGSIINYLQ